MLSNPYRFHGHSSLRYVFKNGDTVRSRLLTVRYTRNSHRTLPRFSVSISKKVLKSAVKRNRVRRRIYEIIRLQVPHIHAASDVVFIVTSPEILTLEYDVVEAAVVKCLAEAGLSSAPES